MNIVAVLLVCWGAAVFLNYWAGFDLFPTGVLKAVSSQGLTLAAEDFLAAMVGHSRNISVAAAVLLASAGAGVPVARLLRIRSGPLTAGLPLGLIVLSTTGLGLGLDGLAFRFVLAAVAAGGIAAGGASVLRFVRASPAAGSSGLLLLVAAVSVPALFGALAPEVTYDALAYHVGAPALYLDLHRIVRFEQMFFTDLPLGFQMIYMIGGGVERIVGGAGSGGAAKVLHWMIGGVCLGVSFRLGETAAGRSVFRGGAWTAAFVAATPFVATQMMRANVDLGVMLFTAAGAFWLLRSSGPAGWLMAGLCLGASASVKLTGSYGVAAGALVLLFSGRDRFDRTARTGIFLAAAALPLLPWLAKSWFATGNPVYPFLSEILGGMGWGPENAAAYAADMKGATSFNLQYPLVLDRFAAPWLMVMHDRGGEAALGPFALMLVPLFAVVRAAGSGRLGLFAAAYWVFWFVSARDPRFFLPAWPAVCALAAASLGAAGTARPVLKWACLAAMVHAPFFVSSVAYRTLNPGPVVWGAIPRDYYADRLVPPAGKYGVLVRTANGLAGGGRILVVGDVKGAGFEAVPLYQSMFDTPHLVRWLKESGSVSRLKVRFRQRGVRAVFLNAAGASYLRGQFGHYRYSGSERRILRSFWREYLKPEREIREDGDLFMALYSLRQFPGSGNDGPLPGDRQ